MREALQTRQSDLLVLSPMSKRVSNKRNGADRKAARAVRETRFAREARKQRQAERDRIRRNWIGL